MKTTEAKTILIVDDSRAEALITKKILSQIAPGDNNGDRAQR